MSNITTIRIKLKPNMTDNEKWKLIQSFFYGHEEVVRALVFSKETIKYFEKCSIKSLEEFGMFIDKNNKYLTVEGIPAVILEDILPNVIYLHFSNFTIKLIIEDSCLIETIVTVEKDFAEALLAEITPPIIFENS